MEEPKELIASVVIPTKNGGKIFENVLRSVLEQDLNVNEAFEVIVVDSGSNDGTVELVKKTQERYPNVVLKEILPKEFGHGRTRNLGASLARGKNVVFITQDALPYNKVWLKNLIAVFNLDPDIAGVFGKHVPYDDCDIFEKYNLKVHFDNFGSDTTVYYIDDKERYDREEGYRHLLCFYSDNSSAMRKEVWARYPYPDVDFAEDQLWAKSIIEKGYKKAYAPESVVYHSHNYTFKQQFKRYFDEYKGLNKIYNYVPVKSVFFIPAYILKHWRSDIRLLRSMPLPRKEKFKWLFYSFVKNFVRYTGAYLGVMGNKHPFLTKLLSREYKIINEVKK